jgi:hypothetical protein
VQVLLGFPRQMARLPVAQEPRAGCRKWIEGPEWAAVRRSWVKKCDGSKKWLLRSLAWEQHSSCDEAFPKLKGAEGAICQKTPEFFKRTPAGQTITIRFLINDSLRVGLRVLIAVAAAN